MLEDLENQNSAFLNDFGSIDSDNDDDSEYDMFKFRNSRTRESNEAIVSCLPCETLRWIKKRRKINSKLKVAMSFFRERQLREIFNGLDYKTQGEIDLNDLKLAVQYVEDSLKGRKGEQLQNLQGMFAAMDEDGNGVVDFQEFCAGMSGSTKSAIDTASEHQIDKLHWKFVEFSRIYKRQKAIDELQAMTEDNSDLLRYGSFRTLFNVGWGLKAHTVKGFDKEQEHEEEVRQGKNANKTEPKLNPLANPLSMSASASALEPKKREFSEKERNTMVSKTGKAVLTKSASVSQILFMTEGRKLYMPSKKEAAAAADAVAKSEALLAAAAAEDDNGEAEQSEKDRAYNELQHRLRCHRIVAQENMLRDPDARDIQKRIEQESKFQRDAMKFKPWLPKHRRKHKQSKDLPNTFVYGTTDYELPIVKTEQSMKLQAIKEAQEIIKSRPSSPGELRNNNIDDASLSATTTSDKFESDEIKIKNKLRREIYKDSKFFKKYGDMTIEDDDRYNYLRVRPNSGTDAHCRPSSGPGLRVRIDYSKPLQSAKSSVEGEHRQHFFNDDVSASNSTTRLSSVGSMTSKSTDRGLSMLKRVREENRIKREEDQRNKGKAFSKIHATTTGEKHTLSNNLKKHTKSGPALATPATSIFGEEADSVVAKALANANMEAAIIAKARQEHALNAFAPSVAAKKESQDEEKEHIPKAFAPKMFKRAATVREIQLKNNLSEMPEVHSRQKKREETQPKIIDVESRISTPKPNTSIIKAIKKDKQKHINDLTKKSIKHLNYFPSIPNRLK